MLVQKNWIKREGQCAGCRDWTETGSAGVQQKLLRALRRKVTGSSSRSIAYPVIATVLSI